MKGMDYSQLNGQTGQLESVYNSTSTNYHDTSNLPQTSESDRLLLPSKETIDGPDSDELFTAIGFQHSCFLTVVYHALGVLTLGFLYLIIYWRPDWKVLWKKRSLLCSADILLLKDLDGAKWVVDVDVETIKASECDQVPHEYVCSMSYSRSRIILSNSLCTCAYNDSQDGRHIRYFVFQYMKYVWNFKNKQFECLVGLGKNVSINSLLNDYRGYTPEERKQRHNIYGRNLITIEVKSYGKLLFTEVLNPFYIFQVASIILWTCDQYYLYAICIFLISCLSIGASLFETRKQSESLRSMVEASNTNAVYVRCSDDGGKPKEIGVSDVVPGDVIVIPSSGCIMACDAVLISGNTIVNESMLTGESVPVTKTSFTVSEEVETYSSEKHKRHTLFCGTTVIQTRYYGKAQVLAIVVRTGFSTAKGELVRSILYPRPIDFKFYKDSMKFIGFLFGIALVGMSYSLYLHIVRAKPMITTVIRTLDIVTIVVPPALPAAMTVGTYYAQSRLKKLGIFCISPPRINVSGKMKLVCFDKTGTLTGEGLDVWGVIGVERNIVTNGKILGQPSSQIHELDPKSSLTISLAACHSLTYVNRELIGDPLDLQMFKATKWSLVEPDQDSECYDNLIPTMVKPPSSPTNRPFCDTSDDQLSMTLDEIDCKHPASEGPKADYFSKIQSMETRDNVVEGLPVKQIAQDLVIQSASETSALNCYSPFQDAFFEVPYEVGIIRQFPFSSSIQRMAVIVRILGSRHMELYVKGAPEVIQLLCKPETIPENFSSVMNKLTVSGYRVIALAQKNLKKLSWHGAQRIKRDQIEYEMNFLGLLVLQNVLKPESTPVIHQLKKANIRTVMVTGDNIMTGISVARDCGMIDANERVLLAKVIQEDSQRCLVFESAHSGGLSESLSVSRDKAFTEVDMEKCDGFCLAVSGSVWVQIEEYFPEYISYIVSQGTVFGRMSPDQKVQVVEELMALQYVVGMCGDGANDCAALKAAHVGISLSEAEASVAAPFTSRTPNITCVPQIICEGRGALATNFSVFKYMALYSIIQFISILILYYACTNLSDPQFLYIDLFIVTVIAIFMGYTKANHKLGAQRPLSNLIGAENILSVLLQIIWVAVVQILAYYFLALQPWYVAQSDCADEDSDNVVNTWETNVIFCISSFQYLALAVIYSPGLPFRKPLYSNVWLLAAIVVLTATTLWLAIYPTAPVAAFMQLKNYPADYPFIFRGIILLFALFHFIVGAIIEYYVSGSIIVKRIFHFLCHKKQPKNLYKIISNKIQEDPLWPPVEGRPIYSSIT